MTVFAWVIRALLLLLLTPLLLPLASLIPAAFVSPFTLVLLILALALLALAIVLGLALGAFGRLVDLVIVLGFIALVWKWPRGIRAAFWDKPRLAYRSLIYAFRGQIRRLSSAELALCLGIVLIALILAISSGFLHFFLTVVVVLAAVGIVWKWPTASALPFLTKLRLALRELAKEIRRRLR